MCGEKLCDKLHIIVDKGSPPRVRGKGYVECPDRDFLRITPACAGKSFGFNIVAEETEDHPRVCGEKHTSAASGFR